MSWLDSLTGGIGQTFGNLQNNMFPADPSLGADPAQVQRAQNMGLMQLGLGLLGSQHTMNPAASFAQSFVGAQSDYQGAMQNAFKNTVTKHELDRQATLDAQAASDRAGQERTSAAVTGQKLLSGFKNAQNPNAYWDMVNQTQEVQDLTKLGIKLPPPTTTNPDGSVATPDLGAFQQQLSTLSGLEAPQQPLLKLGAGETVVRPDATGTNFTTAYTTPPKQDLQRTDSGLTFNPATGSYLDSSGNKLTSAQVASREAQLAANKAAQTTAATNAAKLAAFPKGSLDGAVESYMQTGTVPGGISRSPQSSAMFWAAVKDRASADGKPLAVSIADARMRGSLKPAMEQTEKQLAANQGFLGTLDKNISAADQFAQRVGGSTSPALNEIFNKWKRGVTGDPDVAAFDVFNNSINGEAAKIASGGVGSVSASSDTQIKTQQSALNSAKNYKAWRSAANAMLTEGHNRIQSLTETRDALTQQSAGVTGVGTIPAASTPTAATTPIVGLPPDIQALVDKHAH